MSLAPVEGETGHALGFPGLWVQTQQQESRLPEDTWRPGGHLRGGGLQVHQKEDFPQEELGRAVQAEGVLTQEVGDTWGADEHRGRKGDQDISGPADMGEPQEVQTCPTPDEDDSGAGARARLGKAPGPTASPPTD